MVKQDAPNRIYTSLTPGLKAIRNNLKDLGYTDSEMLKEGLRCLARREGLLSAKEAIAA